ncbi:MAG: triose-phosphate isomerase [Candidatus Omnitrophica bacterium]|nr:triose-phosphate isomerase [Candidatus Omnitrophota bacterium]MBU1851743.1 triose-phosphate isomerase [Candidatus Omnitrophota bacterium]
MRRPMIAGNWKMYKDVNEAAALVADLKRVVFDIDNVDIVVIPPFTDLSDVGEMLIESNIALGAQNCFWEREGAFTGEISAKMLKSVRCVYVTIGHSERRKYFGETDETVNRRIKAVLDNGLVPIVCVGETLEERENARTIEVVRTQVSGALKGLSEEYIEPMVIAYEPVWAIGTGRTATPGQAQEVHAMIRGLLKEMYSSSLSEGKRILYGGSVKPENIEDLMKEEDIDGGLIGGASLKADSFAALAQTTSDVYS